jgi:hypothetical protein
MSKLLSPIAALAASLALLFRHYHRVAAFYMLFGVATLAFLFAVVAIRRVRFSHLLEEMRRLAD